MGQTFSEPVTEKESSTENNETYLVASSSIQGWRISMEDAHTIMLTMPDDEGTSFFAVFDGHGGAKVANYASENLHKGLCSHQLYREGRIAEALKSLFVEFDEMMFNDEKMSDELAGSTAVIVLIKDRQIYCANIGDSRAVASFGGKVDPLSIDHKPTNASEMNRVISAGGWVQYNRVNGNLALSRAFGDFVFKRNEKRSAIEQIVIAYPDVQQRTLSNELEFIVMACDGVWDVMTNDEVVEFVRRRIVYRMEPVAICEELITRCLAPDCQMGSGIGCDNMTVILICYLNGASYESFCDRVASLNPLLSTGQQQQQQQSRNKRGGAGGPCFGTELDPHGNHRIASAVATTTTATTVTANNQNNNNNIANNNNNTTNNNLPLDHGTVSVEIADNTSTDVLTGSGNHTSAAARAIGDNDDEDLGDEYSTDSCSSSSSSSVSSFDDPQQQQTGNPLTDAVTNRGPNHNLNSQSSNGILVPSALNSSSTSPNNSNAFLLATATPPVGMDLPSSNLNQTSSVSSSSSTPIVANKSSSHTNLDLGLTSAISTSTPTPTIINITPALSASASAATAAICTQITITDTSNDPSPSEASQNSATISTETNIN